MPLRDQPLRPQTYREDRDAVGYSNKRVASHGPPVVRPFAATWEGREEKQRLRDDAARDQRQREFEAGQSSHGFHSQQPRGRGLQPFRGYRGRGGTRGRGGMGGNRSEEGIAGPSNWQNSRVYSPSRPSTDPSRFATHAAQSTPSDPVKSIRHSQAPPIPLGPSAALASYPTVPMRHTLPLRPTDHFVPPSTATQSANQLSENSPPPLPPTTIHLPAQSTPAPKLIFRPTRRGDAQSRSQNKAPAHDGTATTEEGDRSQVDELVEDGKEDSKPTVEELAYEPIDPAKQKSGTVAFSKKDIPDACYNAPGKERVLARQEFKNLQYANLNASGRTPTHAKWRDDGFAVDWHRDTMQPVEPIPDIPSHPKSSSTLSPTSANISTSVPFDQSNSISRSDTIALNRASPAIHGPGHSELSNLILPPQYRPSHLEPAEAAELLTWKREKWVLPCYRGCRLEEVATPAHLDQTKYYTLRRTVLAPGEIWEPPNWLNLPNAEPGRAKKKRDRTTDPVEGKKGEGKKEKKAKKLKDSAPGTPVLPAPLSAIAVPKVPGPSTWAGKSRSIPAQPPAPITSVMPPAKVASPLPIQPPTTTVATVPTSDSDTLAQLETRLFDYLETIERWTDMISRYPSREAGLRKQVERVQVDIFKVEQEISRRRNGGT